MFKVGWQLRSWFQRMQRMDGIGNRTRIERCHSQAIRRVVKAVGSD